MNRLRLTKKKVVSLLSTTVAIFCVIILILPSLVQAETTRDVNIGAIVDGEPLEITFSAFAYATFNLYNISSDTSLFVEIENADGNYPMSLQRGTNNSVTFGNIASNLSSNYLLLDLEGSNSYKLRFNVNDDMVVKFSYFNESILNITDAARFHGYPILNDGTNDYIDFGVNNGTAHSVTLSSASQLTYTTFYNSTYVSNQTFSGSRSIYLSSLTTKLRVYGSSSSMIHMDIAYAVSLPSSGSGAYFDDETVIIPIIDQPTYDNIVNEYSIIPRDNWTAFEDVILSFSSNGNNLTIEKGNLNLTYFDDEIYAEFISNRQIIGGGYKINFTGNYTDYVDYDTDFDYLKSYELIDDDGDGYPIVNVIYQTCSVHKEGNLTSYYYNTTTPLEFSDAEPNDSDPYMPVSYKDLDNDGLGNDKEIFYYGTDPSLTDTDDDGLGDGFEADYWDYDTLSPLTWVDLYYPDITNWEKRNMFTPLGDIDNDSVPNILDFDADGDEIPDGLEYDGYETWIAGILRQFNTYPFSPDYDLDGLSDGNEAFGYHVVDTIAAQDCYDGLFYKTYYQGNYSSIYNDYSVAFLTTDDYITINFSIPTKGEYYVRVEQQVYSDDYILVNYTQQELQDLENITDIVVYDDNDNLMNPLEHQGYATVTMEGNMSTVFATAYLNLYVDKDSKFDLQTVGSYYATISPSQHFDTRNIIVIDNIEILRLGLDPEVPDTDNDGLGDGLFTLVNSTYYNIGELNTGSYALISDSDGDGITDGNEVNINQFWNRFNYTSPGEFDSDDDGLLDGENVTVNIQTHKQKYNKFLRSGIYSTSDDNVTFFFHGEEAYNTNATNIDTDDDGVLDGPDQYIEYYSDKFYQLISTNITGTETIDILETTPLYLSDEDTNGWTRAVDAQNAYLGTRYFHVFIFKGEITSGTNNTNNDTDNDGLLDGYEIRYGFNNSINDSGLDPDNDNRTNLEEYNNFKPLGRKAIWWYGTNPLDKDTDLDGLYDEFEYLNGTDPRNYDTDNDELPDSWEVFYNLSALDNGTHNITINQFGLYTCTQNGSIVNGSTGDKDYDGLINLYEYQYNMHPMWRETVTLEFWVRPQHNLTDLNNGPMGPYWGGLIPNHPDYDNDSLLDGGFTLLNLSLSTDEEAINYLKNYGIVNSTDDDNITFYGEGYYSTEPMNSDTDDDGFKDGKEARGFNLTISIRTTEWNNGTIYVITDPANNDTDMDGLSDNFE